MAQSNLVFNATFSVDEITFAIDASADEITFGIEAATDEISFGADMVADEISFGIDMSAESQSIEVGFDHLQIVTQGSENFQTYEGSYTVTPAIEAQTLETKDRIMEEDLQVLEIPYFETSNQSGTTVIIGG